MSGRDWRPWHGEPYRAAPGEPRACLYAWTDGGSVHMGCGPLHSIEALGDRLEEHSVAVAQVVSCPGEPHGVFVTPRYEVVAEALARAEGRSPRPYTERITARSSGAPGGES